MPRPGLGYDTPPQPAASSDNETVRSAQRAVGRLVDAVATEGTPAIDRMMQVIGAASASHGGALRQSQAMAK
eukprot:10799643-Alexandrium_andersonii.AAC.1